MDPAAPGFPVESSPPMGPSGELPPPGMGTPLHLCQGAQILTAEAVGPRVVGAMSDTEKSGPEATLASQGPYDLYPERRHTWLARTVSRGPEGSRFSPAAYLDLSLPPTMFALDTSTDGLEALWSVLAIWEANPNCSLLLRAYITGSGASTATDVSPLALLTPANILGRGGNPMTSSPWQLPTPTDRYRAAYGTREVSCVTVAYGAEGQGARPGCSHLVRA